MVMFLYRLSKLFFQEHLFVGFCTLSCGAEFCDFGVFPAVLSILGQQSLADCQMVRIMTVLTFAHSVQTRF